MYKRQHKTTGSKVFADVVVVSQDCNQYSKGRGSDEKLYGCVPGKELVAGQLKGDRPKKTNDTCGGDSGGAFLVPEFKNYSDVKSYYEGVSSPPPPSAPSFKLAAITSRGVKNSKGACGYGGNYTLLTSTVGEWISENVKKYN